MTIDDPRINEFLRLWHENGRAAFEKSYPSLNYDSEHYAKTAKDRSKYIALDDGMSGAFLIDKATELVYCIKAYGVPNKRKCCGALDELIRKYAEVNEANALALIFPREFMTDDERLVWNHWSRGWAHGFVRKLGRNWHITEGAGHRVMVGIVSGPSWKTKREALAFIDNFILDVLPRRCRERAGLE